MHEWYLLGRLLEVELLGGKVSAPSVLRDIVKLLSADVAPYYPPNFPQALAYRVCYCKLKSLSEICFQCSFNLHLFYEWGWTSFHIFKAHCVSFLCVVFYILCSFSCFFFFAHFYIGLLVDFAFCFYLWIFYILGKLASSYTSYKYFLKVYIVFWLYNIFAMWEYFLFNVAKYISLFGMYGCWNLLIVKNVFLLRERSLLKQLNILYFYDYLQDIYCINWSPSLPHISALDKHGMIKSDHCF